MRRFLVLLNSAAGTLVSSTTNDESRRVIDRFASHGVSAEVRRVAGADLERTTRAARDGGGYDLIIAGGGDGTLNTVAGALVGGPVPFGVLPLGTFNHLAKELGLPLDLEAAIDTLVDGETVPFNIGRVNGQVFLLFVAIGVYSDMIRHRDAQRKALGRPKMWAGAIASLRMLIRWPLMHVTASNIQPPADRASITRRTTAVSVSISGYQLRQMGLTHVPHDMRESLSVLVSPYTRRLGLLWFIIKALFRKAELARDIELLRVTSVDLQVRGKETVRVGYDGEVATMQTPLKLEIVCGGLLMRVPRLAADERG